MSRNRTVAVVGPSLSGKTTLVENILAVSGAVSRKGTVKEGNTVADASAEARERHISTEVSTVTVDIGDDTFTLLDCPGSIELAAEARNALMGADAALVVFEADESRLSMMAPILRFIATHDIPTIGFVNKMDRAVTPLRDLIPRIRRHAARPFILAQVPIWEGETVTGYVDLITGQAYSYGAGGSEAVALPETVAERREQAHTELLESLADFDDTLLEALLEDRQPSEDEVRQYLLDQVAANHVVPVFIGAAEQESGVRRLIAHLARFVPAAAVTAEHRGIDGQGEPLAQVLKTYVTPHGGKLSLVRLWRGEVPDGTTLNGMRVAGIYRLMGAQQSKLAKAEAGDVVAFGRLEDAHTGDTLVKGSAPPAEALPRAEPLPAVYALAIAAEKRDDEVKLSTAVAKVLEEDPSLSVEQNQETNEFLLWGQGEVHLQVALARLRHKYNLAVKTRPPTVAYKEAIRRGVSQHGRFKRQTGGHGMFGDVHLDIKPLPRGSGFDFRATIVGGSVPRQYIPAVEAGAREYLAKGPLGFPVVDVSITLTDGAFHSVDSNEQSFKLAAREALKEGLPKCDPVLLEPIYHVTLVIPNDATSKVHGLISGRRGQILGFQAKEGWDGWDEIEAHIPQAEMHDLIIEVRSLTQGVGWFTFAYDHLSEIAGRLADEALARHAEAAEA